MARNGQGHEIAGSGLVEASYRARRRMIVWPRSGIPRYPRNSMCPFTSETYAESVRPDEPS